MQATRRNLLSLFGIGAAAAALVLGVSLAGDARDPEYDEREQLRIVIVDDDGVRHREVHEFDRDHPRPFLGIRLEDDDGVRVSQVIADSGAERAGVREGDVIVGFDGEPVERSRDLHRYVLRREAGDRVELELIRDGARESVTVELGERDDGVGLFMHGFDAGALEETLEGLGERLEGLEFHLEGFDSEAFEERMEQLHERLEGLDFEFDFGEMEFGRHGVFVHDARPRLGVELVATTPELREHLGADAEAGVLVSRLLPDMPAEQAGMRVGDLIVGVDGEPIESSSDLRRALRRAEDETIELELVRDGRPMSFSIFIPEPEPEPQGHRRFEDDDAAPSRRELRPVVGPRHQT